MVVGKLNRLDAFRLPQRRGLFRLFVDGINVMEIEEAVTIGVERFKQQSHCRVFCAIADQHQCAKTHAILDITRCPASSQVSVAEICTGEDQVGG